MNRQLFLKPIVEFHKNIYLIAELAECSPIIIKNSSNPSSQKNLDVQLYDRTTVQGATFNMRGQLYHRHAKFAMALSGGPVVSALGSESDGMCCALVTCWKKNASSALRLG